MAIRSQKTKIKHGVGTGTPTYSEVEEVTDIKLSGGTVPQIDVTHLMSTSKEYLAGLKDNGTVDVTCNFTNGTVQQAVRADFDNGTISPWQVALDGADTPIIVSFNAFVTKLEGPDAKVDSKLEMTFSLKLTGDITIA